MTILELVTCMGISAFLVGGLASAVRLANQSLDSATGTTATSIDTTAALDQLNADLRLATKFTERTATAATFTVPDRTGDGVPDTIRYTWAGAGSPLTRTVNGLPSPAAAVLGNVQAFNLSYLTKTVQPPIVESPEQILSSYTTSYNAKRGVTSTNWYAETFKPTLPANTISWKITSAEVMLCKDGSSGTLVIKVHATDAANKPTGPALASASVNVASLPDDPIWVSLAFSPVSNIAPNQGMALVITTTSGGVPGEVAVRTSVSPANTDRFYTQSTNAGATWSAPIGTTAAEFKVYGTITTLGP